MEEMEKTECGDNCGCKTTKEESSCGGNCKCKETISNLKSSLTESNDKYIRLYAEFENYKKRTQKEKDDIRDNAKVSVISSILDLDNDIHFAIKNIKDDESRKGVELIGSKITKFLKSHGIESIQTEKYDVDIHEVVSILNQDANSIVDVISKGYTLNGKPFRYPKVILG